MFSAAAYSGNPLAVFPEAGGMADHQMAAIAREMNLSETSFVQGVEGSTYEVRIFTPQTELPFAGHPTIGTAWVLDNLGMLPDPPWLQVSPAGQTPVWAEGDLIFMRREGTVGQDVDSAGELALMAEALGIAPEDIGLEAESLGRRGRLAPAWSDAGLRQLMVPLRDEEVLASCRSPERSLVADVGVYAFTAKGPGEIEARGLFPGVGIPEDPATGSAACALALLLADRLGDVDLTIHQGARIGRPSVLHARARRGRVEVGGRCAPVLQGSLSALP